MKSHAGKIGLFSVPRCPFFQEGCIDDESLTESKQAIRLCLFTHGEVERFAQKRHHRAQLPSGPVKDDA